MNDLTIFLCLRSFYIDPTNYTPTSSIIFLYEVNFIEYVLSKARPFFFIGFLFDIIPIKTRSSILTRTVMYLTNHRFKNFLTMLAISISTQAINFFLSFCSVVAINIALNPSWLKLQHEHVFKRSKSVLPWLEFLRFLLGVPTRIKASGQLLTLRIRIELAHISPKD